MAIRLACFAAAVAAALCLLEGTPHAAAKGGAGFSRLPADDTLTLYRPDKSERQTFVYRDKKGRLDVRALDKVNRFFRCRLTEEIHDIDPELVVLLDRISDHFGGKQIDVISGYRSPTRNALMRRQGRRVARDSLHLRGMAADIEIAGVAPAEIRNFVYSLQEGGVGYYGRRSFVHVDTGAIRTWGWRPPVSARTAAASK